MKIISGIYKGRVLKGFDLEGTRPTMDRVKESIFAVIQEYVPGSVVLDLFAGSGNLGIEALSNGASYLYLCDSNPKVIRIIDQNLSMIGINSCKRYCMDYLKCLELFHQEGITFDLIFLDPPYQTNYIEKALKKIEEYQLLNSDGMIVCESDSLDKIVYPDSFSCVKDKKYGDKFVVFLQKI